MTKQKTLVKVTSRYIVAKAIIYQIQMEDKREDWVPNYHSNDSSQA